MISARQPAFERIHNPMLYQVSYLGGTQTRPGIYDAQVYIANTIHS
jgi:hypothetical protein